MQELEGRNYPIQEDMEFQRRSWLVERTGWAVLGAIVLLALLGLFGHGVLSNTVAGPPPFTVQYERFQRVAKQTRIVIHLDESEPRVTIGAPFHLDYSVASIQPRPERSTATAGGLDLTFARTTSALTIVIWAHPRKFGVARLNVTSGSETRRLWSLVYP